LEKFFGSKTQKEFRMRKFMLGAAMASFVAIGGCTTAQIEQATSTVEGDIQAGTAAVCGVVPTLASIADVVFAVTGQIAISTLSNVAVQAIEADLCSAAPATQSARFRALPTQTSAPAVIGRSKHGVVVSGWRAK
jgi:hypothetical protein